MGTRSVIAGFRYVTLIGTQKCRFLGVWLVRLRLRRKRPKGPRMQRTRRFCRHESGDDPWSPTRLDQERASDPPPFELFPCCGHPTAGEMAVEQIALFAAVEP